MRGACNHISPESYHCLRRHDGARSSVDCERRASRTAASSCVVPAAWASRSSRAQSTSCPGAPASVVTVSCDAPERQIVIDSVGHEEDRGHIGCLEAARGGTLFLECCRQAPSVAQAALLRALETRSVVAVGGISPRPTDVRVMASTRRDWPLARTERSAGIPRPPERRHRRVSRPCESASTKSPRWSLSSCTPLAERPVASRSAAHAGCDGAPASDPWPGNVGQLQAVIRRALLLCD